MSNNYRQRHNSCRASTSSSAVVEGAKSAEDNDFLNDDDGEKKKIHRRKNAARKKLLLIAPCLVFISTVLTISQHAVQLPKEKPVDVGGNVSGSSDGSSQQRQLRQQHPIISHPLPVVVRPQPQKPQKLPLSQPQIPPKQPLSVLTATSTTTSTSTNATITATASTNYFWWKNSTILPQWLKDYLVWHRQQLEVLDRDPDKQQQKWKSYNYLVISCLNRDTRCGGGSDRLKYLPTALKMAAESQRLLFIYWEKPCKLEEFMVPPKGGLNWTLPNVLRRNLDFSQEYKENFKQTYKSKSERHRLVRMRPKSRNGMKPQYNKNLKKGEANYQQVYREIWNVVFTPSEPVAKLIRERQQTLNLTPNQYTVAHVRAQMWDDQSHNLGLIHKSLRCASRLDNKSPIFVASDSAAVIDQALEYNNTNNRVVGWKYNNGKSDPLHLDGFNYTQYRVIPWYNKKPSDFYDTFVDLYMLANARCVAYGKGGYGEWGSFLSFDPNCNINHENSKKC